jgi:hypothetical protein
VDVKGPLVGVICRRKNPSSTLFQSRTLTISRSVSESTAYRGKELDAVTRIAEPSVGKGLNSWRPPRNGVTPCSCRSCVWNLRRCVQGFILSVSICMNADPGCLSLAHDMRKPETRRTGLVNSKYNLQKLRVFFFHVFVPCVVIQLCNVNQQTAHVSS